MKRKLLNSFILPFILIFSYVSAEDVIFVKSKDEVKAKLINLAGKQRMLSQRVAKNYFYVAKGSNKSSASKQLEKSLTDFARTQRKLKKTINDKEIVNLIDFVDMSLEEFRDILKAKYSLDNGIIILDLSESMLEGSDYIVKALSKNVKSNNIIDMAGKQRMLSQRIAKYYIAYQNGIRDDNTILQMKDSVEEFNKILEKLISNDINTPEINKELVAVSKLWSIVNKFYLNIKKGGLPKIVYASTDKITNKMDKIVGLYVNELEKK